MKFCKRCGGALKEKKGYGGSIIYHCDFCNRDYVERVD